jgi:hypothetical protein
MFDLREQARSLCPRAIEVIKECLHSADERIRLLAAQLAMDRAYGKPELRATVDTTHAFIVAPAALSESDWTAMYLSGTAKRPEPATRLMDASAEEPPADPSKAN